MASELIVRGAACQRLGLFENEHGQKADRSLHVASLIGQREAGRPDLRAETHIPLADAHFVLTPKTSSERQSGDEASLHLFVPEIARNSFCEEFTRFH